MSTTASKKYGLILKNSAASLKLAVKPIAAAFANDEDDDIEATSSSEATLSTVRAKMQARREHEKALAEDPTIFDYDNVYEEIQEKKNRKIAEIITTDKERKSKYAGQILEAHKKRLLAQQSREERKQQKEREAEAGQFDDKEKFVTSAYKKQLTEMENFRLQEAIDSRLDELTAVDKQKSGMWKGGFYRTLLNDISRDNNSIVKEELGIKQEVDGLVDVQDKTVDRAEHARKLASLRKNDSDDRVLEFSGDKPTKLTDLDDSDVEPQMNTEVSVQLKPGLNILKSRVKKPTKAEQIRRHFTPSPEYLVGSDSSDEESSREIKRKIERREHHGKQRREKSTESETVKSAKKHHSKIRQHNLVEKKERRKCDEKRRVEKDGEEMKKRTVVEKTKEERLQIIRIILAHRNGPEKIEEMRQRYLERKNGEVVSLPL